MIVDPVISHGARCRPDWTHEGVLGDVMSSSVGVVVVEKVDC